MDLSCSSDVAGGAAPLLESGARNAESLDVSGIVGVSGDVSSLAMRGGMRDDDEAAEGETDVEEGEATGGGTSSGVTARERLSFAARRA